MVVSFFLGYRAATMCIMFRHPLYTNESIIETSKIRKEFEKAKKDIRERAGAEGVGVGTWRDNTVLSLPWLRPCFVFTSSKLEAEQTGRRYKGGDIKESVYFNSVIAQRASCVS